jgi:hypothetical protein
LTFILVAAGRAVMNNFPIRLIDLSRKLKQICVAPLGLVSYF